VVFRDPEVLGKESDRPDAYRRQVGQISERHRPSGGRWQPPVVTSPPCEEEDARVQLHQRGHAEGDAGAQGRPGLPPEEGRQHGRDQRHVDVPGLDALEDDERRPGVEGHRLPRRARHAEQAEQQQPGSDLASQQQYPPGQQAVRGHPRHQGEEGLRPGWVHGALVGPVDVRVDGGIA
jgi:hypothetical protein